MKRLIGIVLALLLVAPVSAQSPQIRQLLLQQMPAATAGGGGIVFTAGGVQTQSPGFATSQSFTANIGTASSDRVVMAVISGGGTIDGVLSINGVSATSVPAATIAAQKTFYANVPTTTGNVTFAYSGNSIGMANVTLSWGMISGQSGGAAVAPTHSGNISSFQNDPIGLAITVDSGGFGFVVAQSGASSAGTATWTGATSSSGDGYAQNSNGNATQWTAAHATASGTVTVSGSQAFSGGSLVYLSFGP